MSKMETHSSNKAEKLLYPGRPFEGIKNILENISLLIADEKRRIKLEDGEKNELLSFEASLAKKLGDLYKIYSPSCELYLDYFATSEGKEELKNHTGIELDTDDPQEIEKIILKNRALFSALEGKIRQGLSQVSLGYANEKIFRELRETTNEEGNINPEGVKVPKRTAFLLSPENAAEKIIGYRNLKEEIKNQIKAIENKLSAGKGGNLDVAKKKVLLMYQRRVNQLIAGQYSSAVMIKKIELLAEDGNLFPEEKKVLKSQKGLSRPETNLSRLDKLLRGASQGYDEFGWKTQITEELKENAIKLAQKWEDNELSRDGLLRERGLDPQKLLKEDISFEKRAAWENQLLDSLDLKSSFSGKDYDPNKGGPAPDNKWRIVGLPNGEYMSVSGKKKVLFDSLTGKRNMIDVTTKLLGHEPAHILQDESESSLPFKIFDIGDNPRSTPLYEGGGFYTQSEISKAAFGFEALPIPHYIRAMLKKLDGGNYIDCVKASYDSELSVLQKSRQSGKLSADEFRIRSEKALRESIKRAKRLFPKEVGLESRTHFLASSEDTSYIEQQLLTEKIKSQGLEKLFFIGAVSLEDIYTLLELGFLNLTEIKELSIEFALKIWEQEKDNYLLEDAA